MSTTIKLIYRSSSVQGREGSLIWRMIKDRYVKYLASGCTCYKEEFDDKAQCFRYDGLSSERRTILLNEEETLSQQKKTLDLIIKQQVRMKGDCDLDEVVDFYNHNRNRFCFLSYIDECAKKSKSLGQLRKYEKYTSAWNKFAKFIGGGKDILTNDLTMDVMEAFNVMLKNEGLQKNTLSYYNRILRAIYNTAVEQELTEDRQPFKKVYTGIAKTVKRAVSIKTIRDIAHLDLSDKPSLDYARDMFMFSFYTRGMSFVDIAFLKKSQLQYGILSYNRHKTGQALNIKWEKPMQDILNKHRANGPYLLDIIDTHSKTDERMQYKNKSLRINNNLHKIGEMIGLQAPLTMYVARHSWASACKASNIPISVISEGMGHDSEETTRIYLAQLDTSVVDKANRKIINQVI